MTFGEKLKEARKNAKLSQEELAVKIGVSRSAIAKWETDKGLPDIQNLKILSSVLNVSIDHLLHDGTKLELSVMRQSIDLSSYGKGRKKVLKDKVVRDHYPSAEIMTLLASEKLTGPEKILNLVTGVLTMFFSLFPFAKALNNMDNEFYLVDQGQKQYLVVVTKEYIESRELAEPMTKKEFEIGNYKFINCGPILYA